MRIMIGLVVLALPCCMAPTSTAPARFDEQLGYERFAVQGDWSAFAEFRDHAAARHLTALGWLRYGCILVDLELHRQAVIAFHRSLELDEGLSRAVLMLSYCYDKLGQGDRASAYLDRLTAVDLSASRDLIEASEAGRWGDVLARARHERQQQRGQAREVTLLAYEIHALAALGQVEEVGRLMRLLLFERRVSPGLEPAVSAEVHQATLLATLAAWKLQG